MTKNVVDHLVEIFGSQNAVAKVAECKQSSVADWKRENRVPSQRIEIMLRNAPDRLTPTDFFPSYQPTEQCRAESEQAGAA